MDDGATPNSNSGEGDGEELDRRIAAAAMGLAADRGWSRTGLVEVARAARLPLADLHRRCPGRSDLLAVVSRLADSAVLAEADPADPLSHAPADPGEKPRDRLFDVMMRRFDALLPYRDGLRAVLRDLPREPLTALAFSCRFGRSMAWMLRAAAIDADRPGGHLLAAGLGAVEARVMRVFLEDDTADLARTMAALDAELRRAERWAGLLRRAPEAPRPAAATEAGPTAG